MLVKPEYSLSIRPINIIQKVIRVFPLYLHHFFKELTEEKGDVWVSCLLYIIGMTCEYFLMQTFICVLKGISKLVKSCIQDTLTVVRR